MGCYFAIQGIENAVRTMGRAGISVAPIIRFVRFAFVPIYILLVAPPLFAYLEGKRNSEADPWVEKAKMLKNKRRATLRKIASQATF